MSDWTIIFSLRRDLHTGDLELDGYYCVNLKRLKEEDTAEQVAARLEGRPPPAMSHQSRSLANAINGLRLRRTFDGAIISMYKLGCDQELTRSEFADIIADWPLSRFKEYEFC